MVKTVQVLGAVVLVIIGVYFLHGIILANFGVYVYNPFSGGYVYITLSDSGQPIIYSSTASTGTLTLPSDALQSQSVTFIGDKVVIQSLGLQSNFTIQQNYYLTNSTLEAWVQTVAQIYPSSTGYKLNLVTNLWKILMNGTRIGGVLIQPPQQTLPVYRILQNSFNLTLESYITTSGNIAQEIDIQISNLPNTIVGRIVSLNFGTTAQFIPKDSLSGRPSGTVIAGNGSGSTTQFTPAFSGYFAPVAFRNGVQTTVSISVMSLSQDSSAERQANLQFALGTGSVSWSYSSGATSTEGYAVVNFL